MFPHPARLLSEYLGAKKSPKIMNTRRETEARTERKISLWSVVRWLKLSPHHQLELTFLLLLFQTIHWDNARHNLDNKKLELLPFQWYFGQGVVAFLADRPVDWVTKWVFFRVGQSSRKVNRAVFSLSGDVTPVCPRRSVSFLSVGQ